MSPPLSPLVLERYELKYLIPRTLVEPISEYVRTYCDLDYYSEISPDQFYTINSLYLDTPRLYLLRSREMAGPFHFNMRVRSYGKQPRPPYFFEIKYKIRDFVRKKRAKVFTEDWARVLQEGVFPAEMVDPGSVQNAQDFGFMKMTYHVEPVILTQYRRKAYLSRVDDYARVTFDRDLCYHEEAEWCVKPRESELIHYDHPGSFENPGENVVLELKCEKKVPLWMVDLIRRFGLLEASFSKFGNSMATHLGRPELVCQGPLYGSPKGDRSELWGVRPAHNPPDPRQSATVPHGSGLAGLVGPSKH